MRICIIGPTHPYRGGISHYTTLLFRHLKKRHGTQFISFTRQYPKWLFPGKTDIDPSKKHICEDNVIKSIDSINPITWINSARLIIKYKPDLVIIPWWVSFWTPQFFTILMLIKRKLKTRVLFVCHNVVEHESTWIDRYLTRIVLRNGDSFIVHSNEDRDNLKAILPDAYVKKTHHPTYDVFDMIKHNPANIKTRFGIRGYMLLFFGFVRPYKGLKFLIKALPEIIKSHDVTLMVVGEFWKDKKEYVDLIEDLGLDDNVVIVDEYVPNEEVGDYFTSADLVVQPYISATGSGIIQTAFAFKKPVIATRVGCLSDVVDDGLTGFLVNPGSSQEIGHAVNRYLNMPNKKSFENNIINQNHRFSWDRLVHVIEDMSNIDKRV